MYDASNHAVDVVLGQKKEKNFRAIYYASKNLNNAQQNYITIEKEKLGVVLAYDKFSLYIIESKVIVFIGHATIRYLFEKKNTKPLLIRWIHLLQKLLLKSGTRKGVKML